MMITSSFFAALVLIFAVHVWAQEEEEDGMLPERFIRSFPSSYLASDLALRFGKRSWDIDGSTKRRIGINEKRRIDINDLALRFGKRTSYSFDPSNLSLRFGKRSFGGMLDGFDEKRAFVLPTDLALRFGKK